MESAAYKRSKTTELFYKINVVIYIFGFPNFWIEELKFSKRFINIYNIFTNINNASHYILILFEIGSFLTQYNLTEKQQFNMWLYGLSHPVLCSYRLILTYHKKTVTKVLYNLTVALKRVYNDPEVERQMIKQIQLYLAAFIFNCTLSMFLYSFDACMNVIHNNVTFTTIVTAYPDVEDRSLPADIARAIFNLIWWIFITRIFASYILVIPLTTCLSHQYKNLQNYFCSLNDIFDRTDLSQEEKEVEYEKDFIIGIKIHRDTLRCTRQIQTVCSEVFSIQIIFNTSMLVVLMAQMMQSERTLASLSAISFTAISILIGTGFFLWNAGDVTIEASHLSTAIYFSGWHNCQARSSVRIGKLVTIALNRAQIPVVLKGFGHINLSYQSYLNIVKSSYSVFSVLF